MLSECNLRFLQQATQGLGPRVRSVRKAVVPQSRLGLNTFTPDLYVGYFRDLSKLAASGEMTPEAILAVMVRYATYPAGTPAPDEPQAK